MGDWYIVSDEHEKILCIDANNLYGYAMGEALRKLLMYETSYDKLQLYFGEKNIRLHYMDTDSFVLSVITKDIINDLKSLEDLFDFSNLSENRERLSNRNKIKIKNRKS